jgi:hypothetical protein
MTGIASEALSGSYNVVDYRIRPAKHAERLMIAEVASRLRFHDVQTYRYVGMGAIYFSDFKLMHRALGINNMISIEGREEDYKRFDWNRPFDGIQMKYGNTRAVLPTIDWSTPSIVWLDYDGQLNTGKLEDIDLLVRECTSGSLLVFSINAEKPSPEGMSRVEREADLVEALRRLVGSDRVDSRLRNSDLRGKQASKIYYRLISNAIEASLARSNALEADPEKHRVWRQLLHITYKDGAMMLTVGGIVFERNQEPFYLSGEFDRLHFIRDGTDHYNIEVPKLTIKEMAFLEHAALDDPHNCCMPEWLVPRDRTNYLRLYRYLPTFVSAEV